MVYDQLAHWDELLTHLIRRLAHMLLHAIRSTLLIDMFLKPLETFQLEFQLFIINANHCKLNMCHELQNIRGVMIHRAIVDEPMQ